MTSSGVDAVVGQRGGDGRGRSRRRSSGSRAPPAASTTVRPAMRSAPVASTPGLRELVSTATRGPAGSGWSASTRDRVEHRPHRRHLDQPGLLVQRLAARADRRGAGAHGDDRPAAADPPGDAGELARVAERLGVHRDHARALVVLPELQQVVAADVALVAERDEPGECPATAGRRAAAPTRRASRTASRWRRCPGAAAATSTSDACSTLPGSGEATPMLAGPMIRRPLRRAALDERVDVDVGALDRGDDHRAAHALGDALVDRRDELRGGHGDDRQPDVVGDVRRPQRTPVAHRSVAVVRVHREHRAGEAARRRCATARRPACPACPTRRSRRSSAAAAGGPSAGCRRGARAARPSR